MQKRKCSQNQARAPWRILNEDIGRRISGETHPVVMQARQYSFIGDITRRFPDWVRLKWLRNIVDRDADAFPHLCAASLIDAMEGDQA